MRFVASTTATRELSFASPRMILCSRLNLNKFISPSLLLLEVCLPVFRLMFELKLSRFQIHLSCKFKRIAFVIFCAQFIWSCKDTFEKTNGGTGFN